MSSFEIVIILVNYNNNFDTIEVVKSISKSMSIDLPYIVLVDNNSISKSIEVDISFYPLNKVIFSNKNIGFARANNLAIDWINDNIDCEYIFILNNDTIIKENTIYELKKSIQGNNIAAVAVPQIRVYDEPQKIWYAGGMLDIKKMTPTINTENIDKQDFTEFASGCAMFFKKSILQKLNGFDPFFFMYDEDVELSLRISKIGFKILYVPSSLIYHKCQGSQNYISKINLPSNQLNPYHPGLIFFLENTIINRRYIIYKHMNGIYYIGAMVFFYIYWCLKGIQFLINKKFKAFILTIRLMFAKTSPAIKFIR